MSDNHSQSTLPQEFWHLLYLLASKTHLQNNPESVLETLGKVIVQESEAEGFHWHWVHDQKVKPSGNWTFKKKDQQPPFIKKLNDPHHEVTTYWTDKLTFQESSYFLSLSESFAPYKQALIIPVSTEGKTTALLQFYFSTSAPHGKFQTPELPEILRTELNRQLEFALIHERERDQVVQLAQASRLSSLGAMAGGIAHEINNPVTIIMGMLKVIIKELNSDKPVDREKICGTLEKARLYTERISKIVKGIRALSRDGSRDPFILSKVQDIIDNTFGLCEASIKTNSIQLSYDLEDPNLMIECRPVQISQVLLNLINNSLDAIGDQKTPWIHVAVKKINDETVEFSVTDSGNGIPESIAIQLMQPFFTTKGAGKGTGLGLSISQEIIKAHYGKFALDREFTNTRFFIQIPIIQNRAPASRAS